MHTSTCQNMIPIDVIKKLIIESEDDNQGFWNTVNVPIRAGKTINITAFANYLLGMMPDQVHHEVLYRSRVMKSLACNVLGYKDLWNHSASEHVYYKDDVEYLKYHYKNSRVSRADYDDSYRRVCATVISTINLNKSMHDVFSRVEKTTAFLINKGPKNKKQHLMLTISKVEFDPMLESKRRILSGMSGCPILVFGSDQKSERFDRGIKLIEQTSSRCSYGTGYVVGVRDLLNRCEHVVEEEIFEQKTYQGNDSLSKEKILSAFGDCAEFDDELDVKQLALCAQKLKAYVDRISSSPKIGNVTHITKEARNKSLFNRVGIPSVGSTGPKISRKIVSAKELEGYRKSFALRKVTSE